MRLYLEANPIILPRILLLADPQIGRFLSQDSFLGQIEGPPSPHRYVYGWDRPTFFVDPDGHEVRTVKEWQTDLKVRS
jgi:hypothetical protein